MLSAVLFGEPKKNSIFCGTSPVRVGMSELKFCLVGLGPVKMFFFCSSLMKETQILVDCCVALRRSRILTR